MKLHDCVSFVKMPPGDTAVKRSRLPLGQCGTILEVANSFYGQELYKVTFGEGFPTIWLREESLELVNHEPAQKIPLGESQLAKHISMDQENIGRLRTWRKYDALGNLAMLAIDVALEAPLDRPSQPGYYCYINRDTVRAIREVLDDAGIPWKQQKKELTP